MVPWDFGSPSPSHRAKFVSYVHGYTSTSKDWFFLLFTQNSLHCKLVVCMKHHFCLYYMFTQTVPNKNYTQAGTHLLP